MKFLRIGLLTGAAAALVGAVTVASTSCSQTPTNIPVRTFQQAQRMDVVCIAVNKDDGTALPGDALTPLPADSCAPVPINANAAALPNHLFAVVTQTTPGTLAVVDLTAGTEIDEDNATPGINFIPVGQHPTDVTVSPDGKMTFVSSADPIKPALYGIDNRRLLGTSTGNPANQPLLYTDLPACSLPQRPDGLVAQPAPGGGYVLLAMLGAVGTTPARIAVYDPAPMLRGARIAVDAGADAGSGDAGAVDEPGQLTPCTLLGATAGLADSTTLPSSFPAGSAWADGVPYVEGGVNLTGTSPTPSPVLADGSTVCTGPVQPTDGGLPLSVTPAVQARPAAMALRTDKPFLYVSDGAVPVIHVIEVTDPAHPVEQAPLLATSVRNPSRVVTVGSIAISPTTRDYQRFLYAVDETDGTVMVFDVTDPVASSHVPMLRPHPELNPFLPPDRLSFSAPVSSVAFVEHDWLLPSQVDSEHYYSGILCNPNPNAHPDSKTFLGKGAYYRADQAGAIQNSGIVEDFPSRLRGIFGFATLTNGTIVPIDVDDWDAPCRRPDPMTDGGVPGFGVGSTTGVPLWSGQSGVLDIPQTPPTSSSDLGEYHAPLTYTTAGGLTESAAVTEEAFFPVSAPHRLRSQFLLEDDPNSGNHMPYLLGVPQLFDQNGAPVQSGTSAPTLLPTLLDPGYYDPSILSNPTEPDPTKRTVASNATTSTTTSDAGGAPVDGGADAGTPGVRISFDDPTAHIDQDWTVTFEGPLPTTAGVPLDLDTNDGYQTLIVATGLLPGGPDAATPPLPPGFCAWGIEDWSIGSARATAAGLSSNAAFTSDYVELADDLLQQGDPYWSQEQNDCWAGTNLSDGSQSMSKLADARFNACANIFGAQGVDAGGSGVGTLADQYPGRDFPIVQAYDDHLVLGRFGWDPKDKQGEQIANRSVVGPDPSNVPFLKLARCCFHHQASFKVRTGGEWVAVGQNGLGLIHHVQVGPGGACQLSCATSDALKNARAVDLSVATPVDPMKPTACPVKAALDPSAGPGRNAATAMRNPMFSFFVAPATGNPGSCPAHTLAVRDSQWRFSLRGGFQPLGISLTQGNVLGVDPQSMRFIAPFGQLAIVDGAQQGLVLIDLNTLGFAHSPYF